MKFRVLEKDWKRTWAEYTEDIQWCFGNGLKLIEEVSGDELGIDAMYMVFAEEDISHEQSITLIKASQFELDDFLYKTDSPIRSSLITVEQIMRENGNCSFILHLANGEKHELICPT